MIWDMMFRGTKKNLSHALDEVAQIAVTDITYIGLVIDIQQMELVLDNENADNHSRAAATATSFRGDGKPNLTQPITEVHALPGILKQRSKEPFEICFQRLVALLQALVGDTKIL